MESELENKNMEKAGEIIEQAYKIIQKTYQEIYAMKDEFAEALREIDPSIELMEEYSYGPKSLYLKNWHVFLFGKTTGKEDEEKLPDKFLVGVTIIFSSLGEVKKISSIDGPEIWICWMKVTNIDESRGKSWPRGWNLAHCLQSEERKYFSDKDLELDGKIYDYHWKEDSKYEKWDGQFVGYPLTVVKDKAFIKEKIIDKLQIKNHIDEI